MEKVWTCQRDGSCCTKPQAIVLTVGEWQELKDETPQRPIVLDKHRIAAGWLAMQAGPCSFYDLAAKACTVYDKRPTVCRAYECGRDDVTTQPFEDRPIPMRVYHDRDFRRQHVLTQRRALKDWGYAHGWMP